jgi:hypothetical protein
MRNFLGDLEIDERPQAFLRSIAAIFILFIVVLSNGMAFAQGGVAAPGRPGDPGDVAFISTGPSGLSSSQCSSSQGCYGQVQQDVFLGIVGNISQDVRDQIHRRLIGASTPAPPLRFTDEQAEFDKSNPFASMRVTDPFNALAYAKAYTKAPPPASVSQWIYGANLIGSADQSNTIGTQISIATVTGAFDITKIGIFSATDALTFIGTGSGSWAHQFSSPGGSWDSSAPAASGTLSYLNGGFSADFTALASWTGYSAAIPLIVASPSNNSVASYTGNAQYRFDFPYSIFIEPTAGVTYTQVFTSSFGTEVADYTEVHGGARIGTEMKWMGYTIEPQLSGSVFKIADYNVGNAALAPAIIPANPNLGLGGRGSAKITVLWTQNLSSYVEGHTTTLSGTKTVPAIAALQTTGGQVGLRYTW